MSLYKRTDSPRSWVKISHGGRTIQRSTGTEDKAQAQEYHDKLKASLWEQQRLGVEPRRAWKEAAVRWLGKHRERVFTYAGKPLGHANTLAWRKALKRAGIANFRWHDLRHTWASWHRQSGTPTHELQRLGGWRSSVMVERYAHLAPDHLAKAAGRLDPMLGGYDLATPERTKG
jgi:integrase